MTDAEYLPLFGTVIAEKVKTKTSIKYKVMINGIKLTLSSDVFIKLFKPKQQQGL